MSRQILIIQTTWHPLCRPLGVWKITISETNQEVKDVGLIIFKNVFYLSGWGFCRIMPEWFLFYVQSGVFFLLRDGIKSWCHFNLSLYLVNFMSLQLSIFSNVYKEEEFLFHKTFYNTQIIESYTGKNQLFNWLNLCRIWSILFVSAEPFVGRVGQADARLSGADLTGGGMLEKRWGRILKMSLLTNRTFFFLFPPN